MPRLAQTIRRWLLMKGPPLSAFCAQPRYVAADRQTAETLGYPLFRGHIIFLPQLAGIVLRLFEKGHYYD